MEICSGQRMGDAARPPTTGDHIIRSVFDGRIKKTRSICETLMPPKHPSFEKHDPDICPWPLQMTLTLVLGDV